MSARRVEDRIFGSVTTRLVHDSIANRTADVLVNAANDQLQMGGGVAAALRSAGGSRFTRRRSGTPRPGSGRW